jgi:hypothetical protein
MAGKPPGDKSVTVYWSNIPLYSSWCTRCCSCSGVPFHSRRSNSRNHRDLCTRHTICCYRSWGQRPRQRQIPPMNSFERMKWSEGKVKWFQVDGANPWTLPPICRLKSTIQLRTWSLKFPKRKKHYLKCEFEILLSHEPISKVFRGIDQRRCSKKNMKNNICTTPAGLIDWMPWTQTSIQG